MPRSIRPTSARDRLGSAAAAATGWPAASQRQGGQGMRNEPGGGHEAVKARVSRDPAILGRKVPPTAFGQISQCQGPRSPLAGKVQDWKTNRAAVAESGVCDLRAIRSFQPGVVAAVAGLSQTRTATGRDGWPSMGTLGANDPGRPRFRMATQAEVVGLAVRNNGEWLSWSVSASAHC